MEFSQRVLNLSLSATSELLHEINILKEKGEKIISFGAGDPDFETHIHVKNAAKKAIDEGFTHYTAVTGITDLKEAIANKIMKEDNFEVSCENIIVSNGAKQCLFNLFQAILNDGDEVIIPKPYWVSYPEIIKFSGGIPVFVETSSVDGFLIKASQISKKITPKTRAIILNNPNNPTGSVVGKNELEKILDLAKKHDLLIVSDEVYRTFVYEKNFHSIASLSSNLDNIAIVNGVSKSHAMTGWRIGYITLAKDTARYVEMIQGHSTSNPNSIAQKATISALELNSNSFDEIKEEFKERRNYMCESLLRMGKFEIPIRPDGAFYVFANIEKFNTDSISFCKSLLSKAKVGAVPGIAFGDDKFVRFSYTSSMDEIKEGISNIERVIQNL